MTRLILINNAASFITILPPLGHHGMPSNQRRMSAC
jgi:hypothetical protein